MQHDGKWEKLPFRGPYYQEKVSIEQLPHNSNKHGSIPKDFNKNINTSISVPPKYKLACYKSKVKPVHFVDPYDHINPIKNNNTDTPLVDAYEYHIREYD